MVCCNRAAWQLLDLEETPTDLRQLFGEDARLTVALNRARRASGSVPAMVRAERTGVDLRLTLTALPGEDGRPSTYLMITAVTRQRGNERMLALKQRLNNAAAEQRRLRDANQRLRQTVEVTLPRLKKLSSTDPLTGLFNRRYFDARLEREWNRARRHLGALALLYIDIDYFKRYNDRFGHPQGDECLKKVAETLQGAVTREFDRVCRIGGEEFAVLLPMTDEPGALGVAQTILHAIRALELPHPDSPERIVTVSIGVGACRPDIEHEAQDFIAQVDAALYAAKRAGRDRLATIPDTPTQAAGMPDTRRAL